MSAELLDKVRQVMANEFVPFLQMDGGDIEVLAAEKGVVRVRLAGTCTGCPSAVYAVIMGMEQEIRKRMPEIEYLLAVP
ncbi:MAG: NifU family protein [Candidatus Acidiferrum sp.]